MKKKHAAGGGFTHAALAGNSDGMRCHLHNSFAGIAVKWAHLSRPHDTTNCSTFSDQIQGQKAVKFEKKPEIFSRLSDQISVNRNFCVMPEVLA